MTRTKETQADKAAQILNPGKPPTPAEEAALDYIGPRRWVLWHSDDLAAATVRLLAQAGLLRDTAQEAEAEKAGSVLRRLSERDRQLHERYSAVVGQIFTDAAERLRAGESPTDVADHLLSERAKANQALAAEKRRSL